MTDSSDVFPARKKKGRQESLKQFFSPSLQNIIDVKTAGATWPLNINGVGAVLMAERI